MKTKLLFLAFASSLFYFLQAQSTINDTLFIDGLSRDIIIYEPATYDGSTAVPLVINLHGYGSNSQQQLLYGNFRPYADVDNFIIVCPNGTRDQTNTRYWNAFASGGATDDVSFISQLIDSLSLIYNIDQNQVFSTGMSNGGFMSYRLACELNNRIAKIASVTGTMFPGLVNSCSPSSSIPVMQIHGTADQVVPYNGIPNTMEPIEDVIDYWVNHNNCDAIPASVSLPDVNMNDGSTVERFNYANGDNNSEVILYKITGGGHTWPDAIIDIPGSNTNRDFNASKVIWEFFKGDPFVGIKEQNTLEGMTIYHHDNGLLIKTQESITEIKISVVNSLGQILLTPNLGSSSTASLSPGMYWVFVESKEGTYSQSFAKF